MRADIAKWPAAKRNRPAAKKYDIRGFVKSYKGGQFFFLSGLSFTKIHESQDCRGRGGGGCISLTPHYHFYPLHRHLDISRVITAERSPLHIASSRTRTGNLWFPSASR